MGREGRSGGGVRHALSNSIWGGGGWLFREEAITRSFHFIGDFDYSGKERFTHPRFVLREGILYDEVKLKRCSKL